ncbi:hypothetical protein DXG01_003822 [Tephrocybe rancida]|nr:hypothetical protein DXG01_003822 [Tephrocybe rancida]
MSDDERLVKVAMATAMEQNGPAPEFKAVHASLNLPPLSIQLTGQADREEYLGDGWLAVLVIDLLIERQTAYTTTAARICCCNRLLAAIMRAGNLGYPGVLVDETEDKPLGDLYEFTTLRHLRLAPYKDALSAARLTFGLIMDALEHEFACKTEYVTQPLSFHASLMIAANRGKRGHHEAIEDVQSVSSSSTVAKKPRISDENSDPNTKKPRPGSISRKERKRKLPFANTTDRSVNGTSMGSTSSLSLVSGSSTPLADRHSFRSRAAVPVSSPWPLEPCPTATAGSETDQSSDDGSTRAEAALYPGSHSPQPLRHSASIVAIAADSTRSRELVEEGWPTQAQHYKAFKAITKTVEGTSQLQELAPPGDHGNAIKNAYVAVRRRRSQVLGDGNSLQNVDSRTNVAETSYAEAQPSSAGTSKRPRLQHLPSADLLGR